ncbi:MAG TPA: LPXTG cell wall anchor domain-containing protein [Pyrinomonadaceae bacterium]|jgi:LPXTG-motif cell wall-anchored protein
MLLLLGGMLCSALTLVLLAAYFITGAKKTILMRLAGASAILASLLWIYRSRSMR